MNTDAEAAILDLPCPYCNARAGEWCVTTNGFRSSYLHSARFYEWRAREEPAQPEWPPMR